MLEVLFTGFINNILLCGNILNVCIFLKLCSFVYFVKLFQSYILGKWYKLLVIMIYLYARQSFEGLTTWSQQGGWTFENCNTEVMSSSIDDSDIKVKTLLTECMCVCPRARTRGSARAPLWPAALPHPLQAAPAPPSPLPCLARPAIRTVPTVLSPVPPQPWRAGTAGLSVRAVLTNMCYDGDMQYFSYFQLSNFPTLSVASKRHKSGQTYIVLSCKKPSNFWGL